MKNLLGIIGIILLAAFIGCASDQPKIANGGAVSKHEKINYVEFPAKDMDVSKAFFATAFGWKFLDYGPDYCSITNAGVDAGFFKSDLNASTATGSVLLVLYSNDLEGTQLNIEKAGGKIIKPIFSFPGGRRFHFADPNGNEFAVWSE